MVRFFTYFIIAILIVGISYFAISSYHFNKLIQEEIQNITDPVQNSKEPESFNYSDIQSLPAPVRRYLRQSIPDGYPMIKTVRLAHSGYFRTAPDQDWWPIEGEQYYQTDRPGFVWVADVQPVPALWMKVRDKYLDGEGEVLVRFLSAITVAKSSSPKVNQSAFLRYVGELPWFPTAFLSGEYLSWEPVDNQSARAVVSDHGMEASVTFFFNEEDEVIRFFTQDRYRDQAPQDFTGYYRNYKVINGLRIPTEVEVEWNMPDSNFSYARFTLRDIMYNE